MYTLTFLTSNDSLYLTEQVVSMGANDKITQSTLLSDFKGKQSYLIVKWMYYVSYLQVVEQKGNPGPHSHLSVT